MRIEELMRGLPQLETERLILRRLTLDDADEVFEYASDPEVSRFMIWEHHETRQDSLEVLQLFAAQYERGACGPWGLVLKKEGKLIGTCGFVSVNEAHHRAEIGYALGRRYWRRGLMSEAARRILQLGFEELGLNRVEAMCLVQNVASAGVMRKIGMTYEGTMREFMLRKGEYSDLKLYSILKSEWETLGR